MLYHPKNTDIRLKMKQIKKEIQSLSVSNWEVTNA